MLPKMYPKKFGILKFHLHKILTFQCEDMESHCWLGKEHAVFCQTSIIENQSLKIKENYLAKHHVKDATEY